MFSGFWGTVNKTVFWVSREKIQFFNLLVSIAYHLVAFVVTSVISLQLGIKCSKFWLLTQVRSQNIWKRSKMSAEIIFWFTCISTNVNFTASAIRSVAGRPFWGRLSPSLSFHTSTIRNLASAHNCNVRALSYHNHRLHHNHNHQLYSYHLVHHHYHECNMNFT